MRIEQQDWLHSACNVIQLGGECFTKYTLSRIINSLIPEGCLFTLTSLTKLLEVDSITIYVLQISKLRHRLAQGPITSER